MENKKSIGFASRILPFLGALMVFVLCWVILFFGENAGLSDNGDFRRILVASNLEYEDDTDYQFLFKQNYRMEVEGDTFAKKMAYVWQTDTENEIYSSPHFIFIKLSKELNLIWNYITETVETQYNIAWLALMYILMLSMAAWCIFTFFADFKLPVRIAVFLMFIFMFCDAGYIFYFNSMYGEPLQYVALLLLISIGLMIYKRPSIPKAVFFFLALYFFAGSKLANIPCSIIIALLCFAISALREDRKYKICVYTSAVVSVFAIGALYFSIPEWMDRDTTYQSVFYGIVKEANHPRSDLDELGTSADYDVLANTPVYNERSEYEIDIESEEFINGFYGKVSKLDIVLFYLKHPIRFIKKLSTAISNSAYIRPPNIGNSPSTVAHTIDRFDLWSTLRINLKFLYSPIFILILFLLLTLYVAFVDFVVISSKRKLGDKSLYELFAMNILTAGLWINLMMPVLGNGEADLPKHMFLFVNGMDIFFAVAIILLLHISKKKALITVLSFAVLAVIMNINLPKKTMIVGTYNNEPVEWEIFDKLNDGSLILVTKECIEEMAFDDEDNMWESSTLRQWLNTEFLEDFTNEERSKIMRVTNEVILSFEDKERAVAGDHTHYLSILKKDVADLSKTAYHYYLDDYVYIPTLEMMKDINKKKEPFWILCAYADNDNMERYMETDGFILRTKVTNKKGVRAVIRYNMGQNINMPHAE